jgi:hypothetical protein
MTHLVIGTNNYQSGGYYDGTFHMRPLQETLAVLDSPPAVLLFCEAKYFRRDQYRGMRLAERALTQQLDAPYFGLLGTCQRGPIPPAIFYNEDLVTSLYWPGDDRDDPGVFDDQRNFGRFRANDSGREFGAWVEHFHPRNGATRLDEARRIDRYGKDPLPIIGGGDLNCTASGPHFPQRDWRAANHHIRTHKGKHVDDGSPQGHWVADTDALDHLIGRWDSNTGRRFDGAGYHAIAELAWLANPEIAIEPSIIDKPGEGGPDLIDYLLANEAMRPYVIADSYRVHVPDGPPYPSDHRLVIDV